MMDQIDAIIGVIESSRVPNWEVYGFRLEVTENQLRNYDVEIRRRVKNFGYSIRVKDPKGGIGIAPGNSIDPKNVQLCLGLAKLAAKVAKSPPYNFPKPDTYKTVQIEDPKIVNDSVGLVEDRTEQLISLAMDNKDVTPTFGKLRTYIIDTVLANSEGVDARKRETLFYAEMALKAKLNSKLAEYWPKGFVRRTEDMPLEKKIPEWSKIAVDTLKAKPPKTEEMDIILTPEVVGKLLLPVVNFNAVGSTRYSKLSKFSEGETVAGENITIIDDGLYPFGLRTSPFDDEGVPQRTTTLIEKGVFKNFISNQMYGPLIGKSSTGNGVRTPGGIVEIVEIVDIEAKHTMPVSNQITNMYIEPGDMTFDELVKDIKRGLFVPQFSWLFPDAMTSSFGSEIRNAYLIENGELSEPIKGGLVSGHVLDSSVGDQQIIGMLKKVSGMTKDVEITGRCVAPYMRFENVQVAGQD